MPKVSEEKRDESIDGKNRNARAAVSREEDVELTLQATMAHIGSSDANFAPDDDGEEDEEDRPILLAQNDRTNDMIEQVSMIESNVDERRSNGPTFIDTAERREVGRTIFSDRFLTFLPDEAA